MSNTEVKTVSYNGSFKIRYYVVGKVAYICPTDLAPIMAMNGKVIEIGEDRAWDKVEAGRRIFPFFEFFEWFSEQFDKYDYSDDVVLLDPMPW